MRQWSGWRGGKAGRREIGERERGKGRSKGANQGGRGSGVGGVSGRVGEASEGVDEA